MYGSVNHFTDEDRQKLKENIVKAREEQKNYLTGKFEKIDSDVKEINDNIQTLENLIQKMETEIIQMKEVNNTEELKGVVMDVLSDVVSISQTPRGDLRMDDNNKRIEALEVEMKDIKNQLDVFTKDIDAKIKQLTQTKLIFKKK